MHPFTTSCETIFPDFRLAFHLSNTHTHIELKDLGKQALEEVATIVKPDTLLAWHRKLVAKKFDASMQRKSRGRPRVDPELEDLVVQMAKENRSSGYDRIAGALAHLGYGISDQTVGNILKRCSLPPAPEREKSTTWAEFIRRHRGMLWATDFFSTEVWTLGGLVTFYVLFFIKLDAREVHIAGVTPHPTETWMKQVARNLTMEEWGILKPDQYLMHDRGTKFGAAFNQMLDDAAKSFEAIVACWLLCIAIMSLLEVFQRRWGGF